MMLTQLGARLLLAILLLDLGRAQAGQAEAGMTLRLEHGSATVTRTEGLPFFTNQFSERFKFDAAQNPKLRELRDKYRLEEVTAPGRDEFEKQVLLLDWVHRRFGKFGAPSAPSRGALEVLEGIGRGETYFCTQYAQVFASCAASLGWVDRVLALRRHQGVNAKGGSTEHSTTEIWSNQHRKWVMMDPTSNFHVLSNEVPLNAFEIRQEWFYHGGQRLVFVVGREQRRFTKADLPIFLKRFSGFGDLTLEPDELDKYGFIGYIPNTDLMDSGFDYGRMFITRDRLCDGTQWHRRDLPANLALDPYFPLGQAAVELRAAGRALSVELRTLTPNFSHFEIRSAAGGWEQRPGSACNWPVHPGSNKLEVRAVNAFGVAGPLSTIAVELQESRGRLDSARQ
jgi:hypothetical protein